MFNEWENPKGDFTGTVTPQTDLWLRMGPMRVVAHASAGYVYFAHYVKERSWNTDDSVKLEALGTHIRPYMGYAYLNIRDRPGYEIDQRVRRMENRMFAGVDLPLTRKTTIGAGSSGRRPTTPRVRVSTTSFCGFSSTAGPTSTRCRLATRSRR